MRARKINYVSFTMIACNPLFYRGKFDHIDIDFAICTEPPQIARACVTGSFRVVRLYTIARNLTVYIINFEPDFALDFLKIVLYDPQGVIPSPSDSL